MASRRQRYEASLRHQRRRIAAGLLDDNNAAIEEPKNIAYLKRAGFRQNSGKQWVQFAKMPDGRTAYLFIVPEHDRPGFRLESDKHTKLPNIQDLSKLGAAVKALLKSTPKPTSRPTAPSKTSSKYAKYIGKTLFFPANKSYGTPNEIVRIDDIEGDFAYGTVPMKYRGRADRDGQREIPIEDLRTVKSVDALAEKLAMQDRDK